MEYKLLLFLIENKQNSVFLADVAVQVLSKWTVL